MKIDRCIIFGGGGFIGSHLAEALMAKKYPIAIFSRKSWNTLQNLSAISKSIQFIEGDLADTELVKKSIESSDVVFDLIASSVPASSQQFPIKEVTQNILPHIRLMEIACKKKVKKIVYISSGGGIYGHQETLPIDENTLPQPISPHAIGKLTIEYYLHYFARIYNISHMIYRISNVYGPRQIPKKGFGIIPTLFENILRNTRPTLFDHGNLMRDFIYIDDVVDAIQLSFNKKTSSSIYNIGSGKGVSILDLWKHIKHITKADVEPLYEPKRPFDVTAVILDINLFRKEFNWSPKNSISSGLIKTWQWIKRTP